MLVNCIACILESKKIKAKNAPKHTCAKSDKKYSEPDTFISKEQGKYYKIFIYDQKAFSEDSDLFRLQSQYLNGYKIKRFSELWVSRKKMLGPESRGTISWIWVMEDFYKKLCFL